MSIFDLQLCQPWHSVCEEERAGRLASEEKKPKHRPISKWAGHTHTRIHTHKTNFTFETDQSDTMPAISPSPSAGFTKGIEDIDMNSVRLCFQCELEWEDGRNDSLSPVVSKPIYDKSKRLWNTSHWPVVTVGTNYVHQNYSSTSFFLRALVCCYF